MDNFASISGLTQDAMMLCRVVISRLLVCWYVHHWLLHSFASAQCYDVSGKSPRAIGIVGEADFFLPRSQEMSRTPNSALLTAVICEDAYAVRDIAYHYLTLFSLLASTLIFPSPSPLAPIYDAARLTC